MQRISFTISDEDFLTLETDMMVLNTVLKKPKITNVNQLCKRLVTATAARRRYQQKQVFVELEREK